MFSQNVSERTFWLIFFLYLAFIIQFGLFIPQSPGWNKLPQIFAYLIYIAIFIVIDESWDPLERETRPSRQLLVERGILWTLRSTRIIKQRPKNELPVELWWLILDHAVNVPYIMDDGCHAENFFALCAWLDTDMYILLERRTMIRKNLRLVCSSWRSYLNLRKNRDWLYLNSLQHPSRTPKLEGVRRIDVDYAADLRECAYYEQKFLDGHFRSLTHLAIICKTESSIQFQFILEVLATVDLDGLLSLQLSPSLMGFDIDLLEEIISKLSSLRILALDLTRTYPALRLPKLEVLIVAPSRQADFREWKLPDLKHVSYNHGFFRDSTFSNYSTRMNASMPVLQYGKEQLIKHSAQLESLIYNRGPIIDEEFWSTFPNLKSLGLPPGEATFAAFPPPNHPLQALSFLCDAPGNTLHPAKLIQTLSKFGSITRFKTSPSYFDNSIKSGDYITRECADRNIRCYNDWGEEVKPGGSWQWSPLRSQRGVPHI